MILDLSEKTFLWLRDMFDLKVDSELAWCARQRAHPVDPMPAFDFGSGVFKAAAEVESQATRNIIELCEICKDQLGWFGLGVARCINGHSFGKILERLTAGSVGILTTNRPLHFDLSRHSSAREV